MTLEPAWPLHPPPGETDTLRRYVEKLACYYDTTFKSFCFHALSIAYHDGEARSFVDPTEDVLERLSVGLGIPMDDLRTFEERRQQNLEKLVAECAAWCAMPENRQKYEWFFR